jgi:hypothetical protein
VGGRYCLYRFHGDNLVTFTRYLKYTIEHATRTIAPTTSIRARTETGSAVNGVSGDASVGRPSAKESLVSVRMHRGCNSQGDRGCAVAGSVRGSRPGSGAELAANAWRGSDHHLAIHYRAGELQYAEFD